MDGGHGAEAGCTGGLAPCGGGCVDLGADGDNCGACGRTCAGQKCQTGFCEPIRLAFGQVGAKRMAVFGTGVYWTAAGNGAVALVSKGGGSVSVLATGIPAPFGIAVDATAVYFTSEGTAAAQFADGAVEKLPSSGGPPQVLTSGQPRPRDLRVDAASAYWLDYGPPGSGAVTACSLSSCQPRTLSLTMIPYGIAINASQVLFTSVGANALLGVPVDGGAASVLDQGLQQPGGVALDDGHAYVADHFGGIVAAIPLDGGPPETLGVVKGFPDAVATDGKNVYFTNTQPAPNGGAVMRCAVSGCAGLPLPVAPSTQAAIDVVVDDTYAYWLTADGSVWRAAK